MEGFKSLPKMQCFKEGGHAKPKAMCYGGKMKEGGKADIAQDKKVVKKAFAMHDKQEHPGEKTDLSKLKKGGRMKKEGAMVRKYKDGGSVTNVYEAKKKSGDKDNIKNVKQITPTKANASSAAGKGDNTVAKYSGEDGSHVTLKESEEQRAINRLSNAKKYLGKAQQSEFAQDEMRPVPMPNVAPKERTVPMPNVSGGQNNPDFLRNLRPLKRGGKVKKMMTGGTCS